MDLLDCTSKTHEEKAKILHMNHHLIIGDSVGVIDDINSSD